MDLEQKAIERIRMAAEKGLQIVPIDLKTANAFVEELHRHHSKVQGHKFSIGVMKEENARKVSNRRMEVKENDPEN